MLWGHRRKLILTISKCIILITAILKTQRFLYFLKKSKKKKKKTEKFCLKNSKQDIEINFEALSKRTVGLKKFLTRIFYPKNSCFKRSTVLVKKKKNSDQPDSLLLYSEIWSTAM